MSLVDSEKVPKSQLSNAATWNLIELSVTFPSFEPSFFCRCYHPLCYSSVWTAFQRENLKATQIDCPLQTGLVCDLLLSNTSGSAWKYFWEDLWHYAWILAGLAYLFAVVCHIHPTEKPQTRRKLLYTLTSRKPLGKRAVLSMPRSSQASKQHG